MASKKTIAELLQEKNAIKAEMAELKKRQKEKSNAIAVEYCDNLPEEEKQKQIAEAEKILNTAREALQKEKSFFKMAICELRKNYKEKIAVIKSNCAYASDILDFVNYKNKNSLPKVKNSQRIENNFLIFNRIGIQEIKIDISKINWEKNFKEELKKQGINGENRIADNLIYQAQLLVKAEAVKIKK